MIFENTYTYNTSSSGHDDDSGATIIVKKTDPAGTPLSGAVFALNNSRGDAVYEATSNSSGVARFTDVSNGTYTLVEKTAPEDYVIYYLRWSGWRWFEREDNVWEGLTPGTEYVAVGAPFNVNGFEQGAGKLAVTPFETPLE